MILGTWNPEVYASPQSPRGSRQVNALFDHAADLWFLTELHSGTRLPGHAITFSQPRAEAPPTKLKAAISTRWPMELIEAGDNPVEGRLCMARVYPDERESSVLAVCSVLPWRGATPHWRELLGREMTYAEVYKHLLDYVVCRIHAERRPGENVIWGGDFNQGLTGRDYVGTLQGRAALDRAFGDLGLRVPTRDLPAQTADHPAIDHIAIPASWTDTATAEGIVQTHDGRPLSDHDLYLVHTRGPAGR